MSIKEVDLTGMFLGSKYPGKFKKAFDVLKDNNHIDTIIYNIEQYDEFSEWFFETTNQDLDKWLGGYKEGLYDREFPVCISLAKHGHINHQGANHSTTFEEYLKQGYFNHTKLPLDVVVNLENYPEYQV